MTSMFRVTTHTTGYTGAPGFTNFYFIHADPPSTQAQLAVTNTRAFWEAVGGSFPDSWHYAIDAAVAVVEDVDGTISDYVTTTPPSQSVVGNAGGYSAPSGLCIQWKTTGVVNSRLVRGRSFMVPLTSAAYQNDGTLNSSEVTKFQTAATTLRTNTGPTLCVWARPFDPVPPATTPAHRDGSSHVVTASSVADKVAVLRSRRD
jgi:hypothetical protein